MISLIKNNIDKWLITASTGVFLFYVLFVFKGYNITTSPSFSGHSLLTRAICFGILTSIIFFVSEFYVQKRISSTIAYSKLITRIGTTILGINVTFILFNFFWNWTEWSWSSYSNFLYEYPLIVGIPILIVSLISSLLNKKDYAPLQHKNLVFVAENGKDSIEVSTENLLYLKAAGNYTEIHFLYGEVSKFNLVRRSLKSIEAEFEKEGVFLRCHRSYLLNKWMNKTVVKKQNKVSIDLGIVELPVSKSYEELFCSV